MAWTIWEKNRVLRFLLTPEDEDLTGWKQLPTPEGFNPSGDVSWKLVDGTLVPDLSVLKENLLNKVKDLRDSKEASGCTTEFGVFDSDPDSQRKVTGAAMLALLNPSFSVDWRLKNNSIITLDKDAILKVAESMGAFVTSCQYRKNELDTLIKEATSLEELTTIDITTGWPT